MLPNSSCEIVLGSVVMETSGLYTCLVTGGDNPFKEDSNTKTVKVAGWYTTDIIPTNTINIPTNTTLSPPSTTCLYSQFCILCEITFFTEIGNFWSSFMSLREVFKVDECLKNCQKLLELVDWSFYMFQLVRYQPRPYQVFYLVILLGIFSISTAPLSM